MIDTADIRQAWKAAVMREHDGRSILSGEPAEECHHAINQQVLRRRAADLDLPKEQLLWDARVGVPLTQREHRRHHSGHNPIPRETLPQSVFKFADEYALAWWMDKNYAPRRLVKNAAECTKCGDTVESTHRHDFRACKCGEIFVDGGREYLRRGATDLGNIIERSEWSTAA